MHKVYLIDGSGYIFRAFYGILQPMTTKAGLPTNALFGFTRMFQKLFRDVSAQHVAVAFDTKEPTFRHKMYDQYKANRDECPADLVPQMPYFRQIVTALGIKSLEVPGVEADDIIATIAKRMEALGNEVVIVSGDKDLAQLVNDKISVWDAMRDITYDRAAVLQKFGVAPEQVRDYLAIMGDASDNIPGIKGVGPKGAAKLLEHFGTIDQLIANIQQIDTIPGLRGAKSIREKVELGQDILRLSRDLVTLDTAVMPYSEISDADEYAWPGPNFRALEPLFEELEFRSMLQTFNIAGHKFATFRQEQAAPQKNYTILTPQSFPEFLEKLCAVKAFAFDTETTSLDVREAILLGISISWESHSAYYLPLFSNVEGAELLDSDLVRRELGPIFADPAISKAGLNLKFDMQVLQEQGYEVNGIAFDSMLCMYVLNPDRREYGLKHLALKYLGETMTSYDEVCADHENLSFVPLESVGKYACHDADASWSLFEKLDPELGESEAGRSDSPRQAFENIEMPLVPVLAAIERAGIRVNVEYLKSLEDEFRADAEKALAKVYELAGEEFNINSPRQLATIMFERMGIPTTGVKKTKTGLSTDAGVLEMLAQKHEIAAVMLEYREVFKLISTYVEALQRLVHPKTGRIHTSFNQAVAATGRLSSSDPNLQNIPIRNPRGRRIRQAFIAEPGCVLLSADYSQIELRVLAHMSGDRNLQHAFLSGEDIHAKTAREIFGPLAASEEERDNFRRIAKTINFGIIYGISAFRLANQLDVSRRQAQQYIDEYFARYPRVLEYYDTLRDQLAAEGYVSTMFGHRRYREALNVEGRDAGYAERSLLNAPLQGTAAEIIKLAMIRLHSLLPAFKKRAVMVLQVHDELVFEVSEDIVDEVQPLVVREMETAVELAVPLSVNVNRSLTWE